MPGFLETRKLYKEYPGTIAVNDVTCSFEQGKIHALLGKNGSGKSTFVNMISGTVVPTSGDIFFREKKVRFASPHDAIDNGIAVVHQEMSLIPSLSIAENMFLGRLKTKSNVVRYVDWDETERQADHILQRMGVNMSPRTLVSSLSVGQQQQIEIAKALTVHPSLLILDEPTSALALKEVDILFSIMKNLCDEGVTMIYISHRLSELSKIAHTVKVLRDGVYVGALPIEEADNETILHMMFGKVPKLERMNTSAVSHKDVVLSVHDVSRKPFFSKVSFSLYKGEVLGIAGLLGSGRTELLRGIFGLDTLDEGNVFVNGHLVEKMSTVHMKQLGVSYVSEDRKEEGLVQILSAHANLVMASAEDIAHKKYFITKGMEEPYVSAQIESLSIKLSDRFFPVSVLSGGNQQKIVVGNWLNTKPSIMLFDEPSRGIDVESKRQIFKIMWAQKEKGISAIMVSSELEELLEVCDRILILKNGSITEEINPFTITVNQLYQKCTV